MAATPAKQRRVESDDMFKYQNWDCHHDFSSHVRNKNRRLRSRTEKFEYFSSLSPAFVLPNSLADPDVVNFISDLYGSVKRQLLSLQEENRAVDANVDDAHYKLFLGNLRVDGKSYVLDIPRDGVLVKYEPEDYASSPTPSASNPTHDSDHISFDTNFSSDGTKRKHCSANNAGVLSNQGSEAEKQDTERKGKRRRGIPKQHDANSTGVGSKEGFKVKEEEEDYEDDRPDVKKLVQEPVVNVDQWWHKKEVSAWKRTEFREKLVDVLKKPYCEIEYERLLEQLNQRKPVQNHRNLRGRTITYEEKRPGKSFVDHHTDLARRIDSVRDDHPRVLNLLRGFFYWLKNLSHEGAFLPWKDPSCLEVLPP